MNATYAVRKEVTLVGLSFISIMTMKQVLSENYSALVATLVSLRSKALSVMCGYGTFSNTRLYRKPDLVIGDNYLRRWWVIPRNRFFNIYLHEINNSDDDRALHDHPWWNCSIVLKGGYQEVTTRGVRTLRAGNIVFRLGTFLHRLVIPEGGQAVTLFITGPKYRHWGFACPKGWRPWEKFVDPNHYGQAGAGCGED